MDFGGFFRLHRLEDGWNDVSNVQLMKTFVPYILEEEKLVCKSS